MSSTMVDAVLRLGALWVLAASVGILMIALLRPLLRRHIGARGVLLLWWILPVALLAVALPKEVEVVLPDEPPGALMVWEGGARQSSDPGVDTATLPATAAQTTASAPMNWRWALLVVWLGGAIALTTRVALAQRRFNRSIDWRAGKRGTLPPMGVPAVVGVFSPRIALPADFRSRYSAEERRLILLHETVHLRRRDGLANLGMAILRVLQWFNPLVHWAAAALGDDQEAACDAAVIARHPDAVRTYAQALLRSDVRVPPLPLVCHWQAYHPTVKRVAMLKQHRVGAQRTLLSVAVLAVGALSAAATVFAVQPAREIHVAPPVVEVTPPAEAPIALLPVVQANRMGVLARMVPTTALKQEGGGGGAEPAASSVAASESTYAVSMTVMRDGTSLAAPSLLVSPGRQFEVSFGGIPVQPSFRSRMTAVPLPDGRIEVTTEATVTWADSANPSGGKPSLFKIIMLPGERALFKVDDGNRPALEVSVTIQPVPKFLAGAATRVGTDAAGSVTLIDAFRCVPGKPSELARLLKLFQDDVRLTAVYRSEDGKLLRLVGQAPNRARVARLMNELRVELAFKGVTLLTFNQRAPEDSEFQIELGLNCDEVVTPEQTSHNLMMTMSQALLSTSRMSINLNDAPLASIFLTVSNFLTVGITGTSRLPDVRASLKVTNKPAGPLLQALLHCNGFTLVGDMSKPRQYFLSPHGTAVAQPLQQCVDSVITDYGINRNP